MHEPVQQESRKREDVKFTHAIVRRPARSMVRGLTSSNLGAPDHVLALAQHDAYIEALRGCGLAVTILESDDDYPDSTFVEDTALVTPRLAIIMRPGAHSRRGETPSIERVLATFYNRISTVEPPGTADAGDILTVDEHIYIGLSRRTNQEGADQIIQFVASVGMTGSTVPLRDMLHLKSGAAYLENGNMVLAGELFGRSEFSKYAVIHVGVTELYGANCLWLNGTVLVASRYPIVKQAIEARGYPTIALDMSEFRKLDGGLSCLSLRF